MLFGNDREWVMGKAPVTPVVSCALKSGVSLLWNHRQQTMTLAFLFPVSKCQNMYLLTVGSSASESCHPPGPLPKEGGERGLFCGVLRQKRAQKLHMLGKPPTFAPLLAKIPLINI
jgi:hypothetical protein